MDIQAVNITFVTEEDMLLSITSMLNRVTDGFTEAESEKSESDSSTTQHQDCTDADQ